MVYTIGLRVGGLSSLLSHSRLRLKSIFDTGLGYTICFARGLSVIFGLRDERGRGDSLVMCIQLARERYTRETRTLQRRVGAVQSVIRYGGVFGVWQWSGDRSVFFLPTSGIHTKHRFVAVLHTPHDK